MNYFKNFDLNFLLELYGDNIIASLTDTRGIITYVSDAYVKISGYNKKELLGKSQNIVRHPDMPSSIFKELWETISSGKTWKGEIKNLKKNKEFYWVIATIIPQRDDEGSIIGYASVRQDITDKKEAILLHNQIQNMLDNIEDGFLIFDKNFKVQESYSKSCLKILDQNSLCNQNIADILFYNDKEQKETFIFGCEQLFKTECSDTKDIYISLLPEQHYNTKHKYTIHYKVLSDNSLLLLLKDVTVQLELELKMKQEQKIQRMCMAIATHQEESIEVIQSFIVFLKNNLEQLEADKLKMGLHTFKGLFAQFEMLYTVDAIHLIETDLQNKKFDSEDKKKLKSAFYQDVKIITNAFGYLFLSPVKSVKVTIEQINNIIYDMQSIIEKSDIDKNELYEILESIKHMKNQSFFNMLTMHQVVIKNTAKKINKELYPLEIKGSKDLLVDKKFKNFVMSLVHIFRNSIVHGIEEPFIRNQFSKDTRGKIQCIFESNNSNIILKISDDGQGINISELIEKAIESNITTKEKAMKLSEQEILQFIFSNEFSTIDYVDELSGRGVGLASVKYELLKIKGTVEIQNNRFKGLSFLFTIPYKNEIINNSEMLLKFVISTTKSFLSNDIKIETQSILNSKKLHITHHYSTIQLSGFSNVLFVLSLDEELVDKVLEFFLPNGVEKNDEKLKNKLSGEILNLIIGLSLNKFPNDFKQLTLGTPLVLDQFIIETFIEQNQTSIAQFKTEYGNLELAVIILNTLD